MYPQKRKLKNGNAKGQTAEAMANAAESQAMISMTHGRMGGRASLPLRTYTGSASHHRHHNSNTSRKDSYARTDITFLIVFPILFIIFNVCYWSTLYAWRYQIDEIDKSYSTPVSMNNEDTSNSALGGKEDFVSTIDEYREENIDSLMKK